MRDGLVITALSLLPRNAVAKGMGGLARAAVSRWAASAFVRAYGVDLSEADPPDLAAYASLDALFTRRLRDGARPVDPTPGQLVSPVDGTIAAAGPVVDGAIAVAPGRTVGVDALVGEPVREPMDAVVLYLSPRDYHRVHAPLDGRVVGWRYVPGTLWPVFPAAVRGIDGLFARNERLVLMLDVDGARVFVVLVGAFGVGRITSPFEPVVSNTGAPAAEGACDAAVARGEELGVFHLGSTVVVVTPAGRWPVPEREGADGASGRPVRMGARLSG